MQDYEDFIKNSAWIPENMHYNFHFHTVDGYRIFGRGWRLPSYVNVKAVVCLIHGYSEHSGRYEHVADALLQNDYEVMAMDLRGHGQSEGRRGDSPDFKLMEDVVEQFIQEAKMRSNKLPVILHGHGYGANVALNYIIDEEPDIKCAVFTSPWIILAYQPDHLKNILSKTFAKLFPQSKSSGIPDPSLISHDETVVKDYIADPLVHNEMSVRFFLQATKYGKRILKEADKVHVPVLIMHGKDDKICSQQASKKLAENNPDLINYKEWENMYHEIHNEVDRQQVMNYWIEWMDQELSIDNWSMEDNTGESAKL